jgi:hypothetical protein
MNDASSLFRTPYDPRRPTVSSATAFDEASRQSFDRTLLELTKAAIAFGGVDTLTAPRIEAARHEAGHAVVDTALGDKVRCMRPGSSLDEIALAKMTCGYVGPKLGEDPAMLFIDQLGAVRDILVANSATHAAMSARLMRKSSIGPDAIKRFLQNVRRPQ